MNYRAILFEDQQHVTIKCESFVNVQILTFEAIKQLMLDHEKLELSILKTINKGYLI